MVETLSKRKANGEKILSMRTYLGKRRLLLHREKSLETSIKINNLVLGAGLAPMPRREKIKESIWCQKLQPCPAKQ